MRSPKYILLLFCFLLISIQSNAKDKEEIVQDGIVDLSTSDLSKKSINLDGDWEFYWQELLTPSDFQNSSRVKTFGEIPEFWKNYPEKHPKFGYCTYRINVILSKSQQKEDIALRINNIHNSYSLWINDSLMLKVGVVGKDYERTTAAWMPSIVAFPMLNDTNEIILQISNYRHRNGGIQDPIEIGNLEKFDVLVKRQLSSELFLGGSCFILGCFFIGMFFFWKKDRAALHFGIFTTFFATRVLLVGTRSLVYTFPEIPWDFAIRLEYLGMFVMHYSMFHFIYYAFNKQTFKRYLSILRYVTIVLVAITFLPGHFFTYLTIPNNYYLILTFGYSIYIFIKALKDGVAGAKWAVLAMIVFFVTTIPLLLEYSNLFITDPVILSVCYIAFMFLMSLIFAARFGSFFQNLERLKLEEELRSNEILLQKQELERSNEHINDSINYAKRIQSSLLPSENKLKSYFKDCFLFFKPQGTVSGDFYWCAPAGDGENCYLAIADCTGHGVPGAFVSLIGINSLDNIVGSNNNIDPANVLNQLNSIIHNRLQKNDGDIATVNDGLDIVVCKINLKLKCIEFSSAHHKILIIRNDGSNEVVSGQMHHIGAIMPSNFIFSNNVINFEKGDQIYFFSDGIYDQKGGEDGKKLYLKRLQAFLTEIHQKDLAAQKSEVENFVENWVGNKVQMDDMLLFSLKF